MQPLDVPASQLERQTQLLGRLSQPQRSAVVAGLWEAGRRLGEAGVRARNPGASEALVRWLLTSLIYGDAVASRLHGTRPPT